jgi:oligoendopeptidase F
MIAEETYPAWDLSDLYAAPDDPAIPEDHQRLLARAQAFEKQYRGRIESSGCTASLLREALDEFEAIRRAGVRPLAFASLLFSADTSNPAHGALMQKLQVENTGIARHLIFFELEIGRMPEAAFARLIDDPDLATYHHYLRHERRMARHNLSEPEEKIVEELSNTGSRAFMRLFSEITARAKFRMEHNGETKELNQSEILSHLYDPNRSLREAAASGFTATLKEHAHPLTFIYNNVLQEKATMDRLRGFSYPEEARHEANELTPSVVQNVVDVAVEGYAIVADYYRLKRELLGLPELTHVDRYAPLEESTVEIDWETARQTVLEAFADFSPRMRELIEPFFTKGWIDAEVRPGKRGGAFCSYITPDLHPYVFMNYTGKARDVMTLAHELGHAVHGILAGRNNYLEFYPSLPLAETASVFAEMLVFERLQAQIESPRERLSLLCGKIEDTFATVFRQATMFRFEQAAHQARRTEGELTTERLNALWHDHMQEMFGDSVALGDDHACWWLYIPHIFGMPFYVYAYAFGELLVLALYARYKQEGAPFIERYFELLATGSSKAPAEILAAVGIDPEKKEFWQGGIDLIREMVAQARQLASKPG